MDNYFNLLPSEITEIILSYLDTSQDLENISVLLTASINWGTIYSYHFGTYKKLDYLEYLKIIELTELIKTLKLNTQLMN